MSEIYITHRTKGKKTNLDMIHIKASRENIFLHNFERDDENKIMF
jgi:hypothetical protein